MPTKSFLFLVALVISNFGLSQQKETYIKGNPVLGFFGIINVGIEHQFNQHKTLEIDAIYSPWKSIHGNHAQAAMLTIEGRHYFDQAYNKWYIGGNIGGSIFNLTKWNYWNTNRYQKGFNYVIGGTIGYTVQWKEKWILDAHIGGGTIQSFYKGYKIDKNGNTTRYEDAKGYNRSGEIAPYKIGVMIGYKL